VLFRLNQRLINCYSLRRYLQPCLATPYLESIHFPLPNLNPPYVWRINFRRYLIRLSSLERVTRAERLVTAASHGKAVGRARERAVAGRVTISLYRFLPALNRKFYPSSVLWFAGELIPFLSLRWVCRPLDNSKKVKPAHRKVSPSGEMCANKKEPPSSDGPVIGKQNRFFPTLQLGSP
jgi:hypothetical protein